MSEPFRKRIARWLGGAHRPELGVALGVWGLILVLPGVVAGLTLGASAGDPGGTTAFLSKTFGHEVAGYLGYSPFPFLVQTLPSLALSPAVVLLLAMALRPTIATRRFHALELAARVVGAWTLLQALGGLLVVFATALGPGPLGNAFAWAWRLWLIGVVSSFLPIGAAILVASVIRGRVLALATGVILLFVLAVAGTIEQRYVALCAGWSPAGIDRCALSGRTELLAGSILRAVVVLAGCLLLASVGTVVRRRAAAAE